MISVLSGRTRALPDGRRPTPPRPPGPRGRPLVGNTLALAADPLGYLSACRRHYGDLTYLRIRGLDVYVASGEEHLESVLGRDAHCYRPARPSRGLPDALRTIDDPDRWRQRRAVLPSSGEHPSEQHTTAVRAACDRHLSGWPDFGLVDISRGAAHLALDILVGAVLGLPGGAGADRVLDDLVQHVLGLRSTGFPVPSWATAVGRLRARRAVAGLGAVPTAGRGDRLDPGAVAALLAAAARRPDQGGRSAAAVTDELVALLLIGHETVALALAYTCWLLATHTEIQEELAEELDAELTGGPATPAATARVPLLRAVVTEALRLFPPVWAMGREVVHPTELDGYPLAPGARVLIPVWTIHRRPDWYDRPDEFRPDRWLGNREAGLPTAAYLPFGLGHRRCVGDCFAYQELTMAVAEILLRFRLGDCSGPPALLPSITLRTRTPIRLLVERR